MRKVLLNMVFVLSLVLVMTTSSVFASVEGELFTEDINVIEEIKDVQDIYDVDQIYDMDNFYEINKVEDLDINYDMELMAVDRDLWDQNYNNVGSVKKIYLQLIMHTHMILEQSMYLLRIQETQQ